MDFLVNFFNLNENWFTIDCNVLNPLAKSALIPLVLKETASTADSVINFFFLVSEHIIQESMVPNLIVLERLVQEQQHW